MRDLVTDMADEMDRRDAAASGERDTIEHRTTADVMRSNGATEERVVRLFGYSPRPIEAAPMPEEDLVDLVAGIISDNFRFPGAPDGSPTGSAVNSEFIAGKVVASLRSHGLLRGPRSRTWDPVMRWVEIGPGGSQAFSGDKPVASVLSRLSRHMSPGTTGWEWMLTLPKAPGLEMEGTAATEAAAKEAVEFVWLAWLEMLGLQPIPGRT